MIVRRRLGWTFHAFRVDVIHFIPLRVGKVLSHLSDLHYVNVAVCSPSAWFRYIYLLLLPLLLWFDPCNLASLLKVLA